MSRLLAVTFLLLGLLSSASFAQSVKLQELEEVAVVGRQPGPPLWKISHGDNVLWILPLVDIYPSKMEWDSARVEQLIAESQEYLHRPVAPRELAWNSASPLSFLRTLGLYNKMTYAKGNSSLAEVLPPDLYNRFKALKSRYMPGNSKIEKMVLPAAHPDLVRSILNRENLEMLRLFSYGSPEVITRKTGKWIAANKAMRKIYPTYSKPYAATSREIKALSQLLEELMESPTFQARQITCFEILVGYFENDLQAAKRRANAWAQGHTEDLVSPTRPYAEAACRNPLAGADDFPALQAFRTQYPEFAASLLPDVEQATRTSREQWMASAERALDTNRSTFALLPINDMLGPEGLVTLLKTKGYTVEISAE